MVQPKKKTLLERLKHRYRLVVMKDDTFEEKFSLRLTPLNMFVLIGFSAILLIFLTASLIAFTSLREYIPGYVDEVKNRKQLITLNMKADSLTILLEQQMMYNENLTRILTGNVGKDSTGIKKDTTKKHQNFNNAPSQADLDLRKQIEDNEKYAIASGTALSAKASSPSSFFFFTPLKGSITHSFNSKEEHFGVDIAARENEAIKCTLDGTVISSGWTQDNGWVIQVQHSNNMISVYKHNSALLKKTGQTVKAGEAIAIIGNSGELSQGTHLHFELWHNGQPIDPQEYMVFGERK